MLCILCYNYNMHCYCFVFKSFMTEVQMDWFLYDRDPRHERVGVTLERCHYILLFLQICKFTQHKKKFSIQDLQQM